MKKLKRIREIVKKPTKKRTEKVHVLTAKNRKGLPATQYYRAPDHFGKILGYKLLRANLKAFETVVAMKIEKKHLSPAGRAHGGVVAAFFDFALASSVFSSMGPDDLCATVDLHVNFLRPIEKGTIVEITSKLEHRGNRLRTVRGVLKVQGSKDVVALGTGIYSVVSTKKTL